MGNVLLILIGSGVGWKLIKNFYIKPKKIKMNLVKYSDPSVVKVEELPDELYNNPIEENTIIDNPIYEKYYDKFCKVIEANIPKEDLGNYYRNFKSLAGKDTNLKAKLFYLMRGKVIGGGYFPIDNTFDPNSSIISRFMNTDTHELLHASSSYFDKEKKIIYCGFQQVFIKEGYDNKKGKRKFETYGLALNEGYTQYLNIKLFDTNDERSKQIYENEQIIAKGLEEIVGEDKLKSLYFRGDLNGLVNELCKYNKKEDVYKFITLTDILCVMSRDISRNTSEIKEAKSFVGSFLINTIIKSKGKVEASEFAKLLNEYVPYNDNRNTDVVISDDIISMLSSKHDNTEDEVITRSVK